MRRGGGLRHDDPLGAGQPAVLIPPRDRIPGDPHRTPVPTLVRLRLGAGRTPALLMLFSMIAQSPDPGQTDGYTDAHRRWSWRLA
jgi:hypothetical protein